MRLLLPVTFIYDLKSDSHKMKEFSKVPFQVLEGKTLIDITVNEDLITFIDTDYNEYFMVHVDSFDLPAQECCEFVTLDNVCGDMKDLLNTPILKAEEVKDHKKRSRKDYTYKKQKHESYTWTFYKLVTIKGYITIRWYGGSTGSYSEDVGLFKRNDINEKEVN